MRCVNFFAKSEKSACIVKLGCAILYAFLFGGIAQLVERLNGIQKVRGSTPLTSTINRKREMRRAVARLFLF